MTGDPFSTGKSPLGLFFTRVEVSRALSRDVFALSLQFPALVGTMAFLIIVKDTLVGKNKGTAGQIEFEI